MKGRKTILLLLICFSLLLHSCLLDLDTFVTPVVFKPERIPAEQDFQFGEYEGETLSQEINTLFPDERVANKEVVTFSSAGNTIYGVLLWDSARDDQTILYCHGNTKHLDHYWARAKLLYETGYNVFLFDYRGFGKSEGTITEEGMLADAYAALEYLVENVGVPKSDILIYGFSIGTVPATELAANADMDECLGLVLEAPVGSAEIYAQDATYLPLPDSFLTEYDLDNASKIKHVQTKLLWLHGTEDSMNKYDTHGQALFDNHGGTEKYKKIVEGAQHSDIPRVLGSDFSVYIKGISDFIGGSVPF
jgi:hypothetical protein